MEILSISVENKVRFAQAVNKLFGEKLSYARRVRNMTQAQLASSIGISRVVIANLERGRQNVQLHQIFSLASALSLPPSELIPTLPEVSPRDSSLDALFVELAKAQLTKEIGGKNEEST